MSFTITSPAFSNNGSIPRKYTCEGPDDSPQLDWAGAPNGTKSFALIVDDPDAPDPKAPKMVYVHWVVYNIPAEIMRLPQNAHKNLPSGARHGSNDWKRATWGGPCPPIGRHRYFFKLYALDMDLRGLTNPTKADVEKAMQEHVLGTAGLIGTYQKAGN